MRSIVFIIRGEATPNLLPITSYFPKNPVSDFILKQELRGNR